MTSEEKQNILKRLNLLELQQTKNLEELSALKEFIQENSSLIDDWMDLSEISGYYINSFSKVELYEDRPVTEENMNVFATENQAKATLAKSKLSQLLKSFKSGWKSNVNNYAILPIIKDDIFSCYICISVFPQFLAFKNRGDAQLFYDTHKELIHDY